MKEEAEVEDRGTVRGRERGWKEDSPWPSVDPDER